MHSLTSTLGLLTTLLITHILATSAASNMVPDFEVKLLLNATAVLDAANGYKIKPTVLAAFSMPTSVSKMNVQFLDTNTQQIYNNGWSPRVRKTEGESNFELTYKKRYPVVGGDINAALTTANSQGFDSTDDNYEAQIEWGYTQKTLSISRKKKATKAGYSGMDLPSQADSIALLVANAPGKFQNWGYSNWGTEMLGSSRIFGPVLAKRSTGTWSGIKLYIEVWPIRDVAGTGIEYIVEASFKTDSVTTAGTEGVDLQSFLEGKGWFLPVDSLKTALIMARY